MSKRIELGTDIAMIGIWDPAHERHDLKDASFSRKDAVYQEEAKSGRLFYVNTGADGSFPIEFFVQESPAAELLEKYVAIARPHLIVCQSGKLIAGGVEDFTTPIKAITNAADEIAIPPGSYALDLYRLDGDKLELERVKVIGAADLAYYRRRWEGLPWGWILFPVASLLLIFSIWVALAVYGIWVIYLVWKSRRNAADVRHQEIAKRIEAFDDRYCGLLVVLRPLGDEEGIRGGWLDWDNIDPEGSLE